MSGLVEGFQNIFEADGLATEVERDRRLCCLKLDLGAHRCAGATLPAVPLQFFLHHAFRFLNREALPLDLFVRFDLLPLRQPCYRFQVPA